jgi:16S rRNA C967 or C1407 C5-methylase (RsmB/RsmF family)/NOL1/NOP2/fmu family ribosome biogenesis protein
MPELSQEFLQSIHNSPGFDEAGFVEAHRQPAPVSIRLNPYKPATLSHHIASPVLWCRDGLYLEQRPNFTRDFLFQAGCYYVQEAGSMFLDHILRSCAPLDEALTVLDLCAAPGGKSTLIQSALNRDSLLVSNEVIKPRAEILSQNLSKWGLANILVTNADPRDFSELHGVFDVIVVDAPCSGSGLFRKQEDAIDEWTPDLVNLCGQRQKRILADALPSLKPGGLLIYSTCSYSVQENEDMADWLMSDYELESVPVELQAVWGVVESRSPLHNASGYRFYPGQTRSEGFYCSVFRQRGDASRTAAHSRNKPKTTLASRKETDLLTHWLHKPEGHAILKFKDDLLLVNEAALRFMNAYPQLYLKRAGTRLGELVRDDLIPHHDLALSIYSSEAIARVEADEEQALRFMKKEAFDAGGAKGWALISYKGYGLGWIKGLGHRLNNYLPNEFKILN